MRSKTNLKLRAESCVRGTFISRRSIQGSDSSQPVRLTGAENRVLGLVAQAKTNKEIARALGISPATVKRHLENVLRKLGLKNRVEVAIYGLLSGGCPAGMHSHCPLQLWRRAKEFATQKWAD
jgi:DNA-binding CsgD family transcriptional regulator